MIIAVDFDGTICRGKYPAIDGLKPYAKDVINQLYNEGHYIIVWTCRSGEELEKAVNYMLASGVKFHRINDHNPETVARYGNNSRKVYAHLYIDDKQVGGLPAWNEIYEWIRRMEEEYKTKQIFGV
jgi:hypothetical protein